MIYTSDLEKPIMDEASEDAVSIVDNGGGSVIEAEIEALNAIFIHELDVCNENGFPITLMLNLEPATADRKEECFVCLTLCITVTKEYPECLPKVLIKNSRGLSDEGLNRILKDINLKADILKGHPMLFELIDIAKEYLTFWNMPSCECAICLYEFHQDDVFTKTECYHYFHSHCLTKYVKYSKEQFEEEEPKGSGIVPKMFQAECPVCRVAIQFVGESDELYPAPSGAASIDESYEISDDIREIQEKLSFLYANQKAKGGIIDLEEEKNKFLIEISSVPTLSLPKVSLPHDDKVKINQTSQPKHEMLHKDSQYLKKKALAKKTAATNNAETSQITDENSHEEVVSVTDVVSDNKTETLIEKDKNNTECESTHEETSKNAERDNRNYNGRYQNRAQNHNYRGNYYNERRGYFGNYRQDNRRYYNGYNYRSNYYNDRKQNFRNNGVVRRESFSNPRNSESEHDNSVDNQGNSVKAFRNRRNSRGNYSSGSQSETTKELLLNGNMKKIEDSLAVENENGKDDEKVLKRPISIKSKNIKFRGNKGKDHNTEIHSKFDDIARASPSRRNRYSSRHSTDNEEIATIVSLNNSSPKSDLPTDNVDPTNDDKHAIATKSQTKRVSRGRNKKLNSPLEVPLIDKLNKEYDDFIQVFKEEYQYCDECGNSNRIIKDAVATFSKELQHSRSCSKNVQQYKYTRPRNDYRGRPQFNRPFRGFRRPYFDNHGRQSSYNKQAAQNSTIPPTDIEDNSKSHPAISKPKDKPDNSPKILHPAAKFHPPGIPVSKPSISTLSTENL